MSSAMIIKYLLNSLKENSSELQTNIYKPFITRLLLVALIIVFLNLVLSATKLYLEGLGFAELEIIGLELIFIGSAIFGLFVLSKTSAFPFLSKNKKTESNLLTRFLINFIKGYTNGKH